MIVGEIIEKIRKTSRGRSIRRFSSRSDSSCMCIEYHGSFKILVLGDQGVGKTSICAKYTGNEDDVCIDSKVDEIFSSCVYINAGSNKRDKVKQYDLEISVANGVYWKGSVEGYKTKILESQGYMLVYSKENRQSYMKLIELLSDIRKIKKCEVPVIIVGNKSDLNQIKTLQVKDSEHVVLGQFAHFDVSAVDNDGLQEAFKCLSQLCAQRFDKSTTTTQENIVE